jgi:translation initiation factor RLI1
MDVGFSQEDKNQLIEAISDKIAWKVDDFLKSIDITFVIQEFLERSDLEGILKELIK